MHALLAAMDELLAESAAPESPSAPSASQL
jgi:hypothetical protein